MKTNACYGISTLSPPSRTQSATTNSKLHTDLSEMYIQGRSYANDELRPGSLVLPPVQEPLHVIGGL